MKSDIIYSHVWRAIGRLAKFGFHIRQRPAIRMLAVVLLAAGGIFLPGSVLATQQQICGNDGTGYCLNDWNNLGVNNYIEMYYGSSSNEDFEARLVDPCHNGGTVTETCPFTDSGIDEANFGDYIVQLYYAPKNLCIGNATSGEGILTGCGDQYGNGAGDGTIMAWTFGNGPNNLIDRYYTNLFDSETYTCSSGSLKGPVYLNESYKTGGGCNWGGL
jgi:hypothetical protein